MTSSTANYRTIQPGQGCDGRFYVAGDYSDRFSAYHLDAERERGNLREVVQVRIVRDESEIQPGELVCFGRNVTVWREVA